MKRAYLRAAVELAAPHTWPAAVTPVLLGTLWAALTGAALRPYVALAVLAAAVLLQSAVNTLNDYADFVSGLDTAQSCADSSDAALVYRGVPPRFALALGLAFLLAAACIGALLVRQCGAGLLVFAGAGLAAILLYVLPGVSLAALPLGEALSGIAMGCMLALAAAAAQGAVLSPAALLWCAPAVLTVGSIMLTNNGCDIEKDRDAGRKTLPVLLGRKKTMQLLRITELSAAALAAANAAIFCTFWQGFAVILAAGTALSAPIRALLAAGPEPEARSARMLGAVKAHSWITGCQAAAAALALVMK